MRFFQITLIAFICVFAGNVSAQKGADYPKAVIKQTSKINTMLKSADEALALTNEQREKVLILMDELVTKTKAIKARGGDDVKAETRTVRQSVNRKISKEVLTKQQAEALRLARKKARG